MLWGRAELVGQRGHAAGSRLRAAAGQAGRLPRHRCMTPAAACAGAGPPQVRAGTGGEEAALWAADLIRMYQKYADSQVGGVVFLVV